MPEDRPSGGLVTRAQLEELAALFDRFEFAIDPLSVEAREAESQFNSRIYEIFRTEIAPHYSSVSEAVFRGKIRTACRALIRKETKFFDSRKQSADKPENS